MDDFISISLLSLAMLVGCYVAGIIPLAVNFSEERLKLVTVLGAGLLCGTALAVIVPEGVHALYEDILEGKHHEASEAQNVIASDKAAEISVVHEHEHSHDHTQLHAYIGVSLVLGFVFMLLVDQIGSSHMHSTDDPETARPSSSKITTTLGLVVHAAADGVALGAAASTSQTSVQLIVFVAIMLHKAPAAFGLVSFLMHAGLERNRIRKHLLVFALAAPVMSMVTYLGLSKHGKEGLDTLKTDLCSKEISIERGRLERLKCFLCTCLSKCSLPSNLGSSSSGTSFRREGVPGTQLVILRLRGRRWNH
ncbi:zinc transporter ZIP9 isoform X3 [Heterocephalus glaber]|uniref:Zinc transporter ZIP9 n=1 Tax=Heterocephalus glaber TaxID=10181 RepID=A0AAX6NUX0_HETGA|nr:zinc transporter ZIP9 isoform X3 [Heterocephalus glaber]